MSQGLGKPKKLKLTDYEVFQTLGTGFIKFKIIQDLLVEFDWQEINRQISMQH